MMIKVIKHLWYKFKAYLAIYDGWVLIGQVLYHFENGKIHNSKEPAYRIFNIEDQYSTSAGNVQMPYGSMSNIVSSKAYVYERHYLEGIYYSKEEWQKELLIRKLAGI